METITQCPSCEEKNLFKKISCKDHTVSHETFSIYECPNCSTLITTPRPDDKKLPSYYLSEDYISHTSKAKTIIDKLYLRARTFTLKQKLNLIEELNIHSSKTILDYGCGTGEFLHTCKQHGWSVNGIEPSRIAREKSETILSISIGDSIENYSKQYTIITLWHVLEHVTNPSETLFKISNRLAINGTIVVAVPNHKSYDAKHYKGYWAAFDVPRHLWHFSPSGMKMLLKKNNLELIQIRPMTLDSFYISLLSERYKRGKLNILGMVSAFTIGLLSNLIALTKTKNYSSLIYIIKKK